MNDDYETAGFHFFEWLKSLFIRLDGPTFGATRSVQWPQVRKAYITAHPACIVCGKTGKLLKPNNVHHIRPFHLHPELELDPTNFCTLCRDHHFFVAHLMSWSSWNVDVKIDAETWRQKILHRPIGESVSSAAND